MRDNLKEREMFEEWAKNEFYSGLASVSDTFDNERNCYADFAHHMSFHAFKAGLAAIAANTPAVPDLIAGALFDFIGHLTSMDESVSFGANEWATPAVELLTAFAEKRGLTLMNPAIERWHEAVSAPQPQPVAQPVQAQPSERCPNCDDTGYVHSIDGEWRGVCHCNAGKSINAQANPSTDSIVQAAVIRALDEANVMNDVLRGMCIEVALEKARDMLEGLK